MVRTTTGSKILFNYSTGSTISENNNYSFFFANRHLSVDSIYVGLTNDTYGCACYVTVLGAICHKMKKSDVFITSEYLGHHLPCHTGI